MGIRVEQLIDSITTADDLSANELVQLEENCVALRWDQADEVFGRLLQVDPPRPGTQFDKMLGKSIDALAASLGERKSSQAGFIQGETRELIYRLYNHLGSNISARPQLLRLLALSGEDDDFRLFAELLSADPPAAAHAVQLALSPFFQDPPADPSPLFPRLRFWMSQIFSRGRSFCRNILPANNRSDSSNCWAESPRAWKTSNSNARAMRTN